VFRLVAIAILALCLGQATGLVAATETLCSDSCPDDNDAGQCSPFCICVSCGCHSVRPMVFVSVAGLDAPPSSRLTFERCERRCPTPEPEEILHVPKRLLG
jgi:hypothetical protein